MQTDRIDSALTQRASEYARATTNTRCAHIGECDRCPLRYCDYKSRYEAYLQGYADYQAIELDSLLLLYKLNYPI